MPEDHQIGQSLGIPLSEIQAAEALLEEERIQLTSEEAAIPLLAHGGPDLDVVWCLKVVGRAKRVAGLTQREYVVRYTLLLGLLASGLLAFLWLGRQEAAIVGHRGPLWLGVVGCVLLGFFLAHVNARQSWEEESAQLRTAIRYARRQANRSAAPDADSLPSAMFGPVRPQQLRPVGFVLLAMLLLSLVAAASYLREAMGHPIESWRAEAWISLVVLVSAPYWLSRAYRILKGSVIEGPLLGPLARIACGLGFIVLGFWLVYAEPGSELALLLLGAIGLWAIISGFRLGRANEQKRQ
jgi:hypothetical protein